MGIIDFKSLSALTAAIIFAVAAIAVWVGGTRLSKLADELSEATGVGRAFIGVLMLGGITSLPELATTVTGSMEGNAGMAVSNILGGISMQVAILAAVDFWVRKQPLSSSTSNISIIIQGGLLVLMLAMAAVFMLFPAFTVFHVGFNSVLIFIGFLFSLFFVHKFNSLYWLSYNRGDVENLQQHIDNLRSRAEQMQDEGAQQDAANPKIPVASYFKKRGLTFTALSVLILVAGYFVVKSSEVIAAKTGISTNLAGLVLVAITTSLPEISTTIGSIRLKRYDMAFSNIFGTNLFDIALIFIADLLFIEGPVFAALDRFAVIAALLGIILTSIFIVGISAKSKRRIIGVGYDSLLILITYLLGILMLFRLDS